MRENFGSEQPFSKEGLCEDRQELGEFIQTIKEKILVGAKELNNKIEERYTEENKIAQRNINWMFDLIDSEAFGLLVEETGTISVLASPRKATQEENAYWPLTVDLSDYYPRCVATATLGRRVLLNDGFVMIDGERYHTASSLYLSHYRLLFSGFSPRFLKEQIGKWLKARGLRL